VRPTALLAEVRAALILLAVVIGFVLLVAALVTSHGPPKPVPCTPRQCPMSYKWWPTGGVSG